METNGVAVGVLSRRPFFLSILTTCRSAGSTARWTIRWLKFCCCACWRFWPGPRLSRHRPHWRQEDRAVAPVPSLQERQPSHDHLGDIFATLDAKAFQCCFVAWVAAMTKTPPEVIAIDGKTSRRSYQKKGSKEALHMGSAFAARQRLVLAQVTVNEQSNEIVAIPMLLDMMAIEGAVVTIDAMGCQRTIAQKIIDKKADYISSRSGAIRVPCRKTSRFLSLSRKLRISRTRRSAGTRSWTAITAASKRGATRYVDWLQ
jgi:hypothetical protein